MDEFEKEIRSILDEKFIEKAKNLKKSGHIFNPIFYLFFTRLVEASGIFNNIVLPNELELEELFKTRKDFLQIDYETISELLRRVWLYERKRGIEFEFEKTSEDMLFLIYRLGKIQSDTETCGMEQRKAHRSLLHPSQGSNRDRRRDKPENSLRGLAWGFTFNSSKTKLKIKFRAPQPSPSCSHQKQQSSTQLRKGSRL